ncbi:CHAT domain-containing protein [Sinorhizobium medicae]|nr:CHAT domain-containing protein [Sinorhizobium medicae]
MSENESSGKAARSRSASKNAAGRSAKVAVNEWNGASGDTLLLDHRNVERALITGEHAGVLEDHFGEGAYAELKQLARDAALRSTRGGTRVLILPGIMGSKLGTKRDVIWLDLIDVAAGRLTELTVGAHGNARIEPLGVILLTYLKLKFRLQIGGFDADFWPYDWRVSVRHSAKLLADKIQSETGSVHLVAHSMGGLVARACLEHKPTKLGRVITLGTPHYGSFSPLQAFRGAHSVVRKLAFLDIRHDQNDLAEIFGTFQGLSEMFPVPGKVPLDLFDLSTWPTGGPRPEAALLARARAVQAALPSGRDSPRGIIQIVGVNQETVVGASVVGSEFVYTIGNDGDGTVPLVCATLADAERTYFVEEEHGALPNNASVARAIQSLIATGQTIELTAQFPLRRAAVTRSVRESELGVDVYEGRPGRRLSKREERSLLAEFAAPPSEALLKGDAGQFADFSRTTDGVAFTDRLVISRQSQRYLDVTLALGSLTEVDADAYVLGLFKNVTLGGAALAVDHLLDGAIAQAASRRMFNGNVGEISVLPKGRRPLRASFVAFAGLGPIDTFDESTLETVGENLVRTFVTAHVGEVATVLMGSGSGMIARSGLASLLTGFVRGLNDADREHVFHRVTICENDPKRYAQLTQDMYALCGGTLFDGIQVTLRTRTLPSPPTRAVEPRGDRQGTEAIYLLVRQMADENDQPALAASVLTKGAKAAIHRGWKPLDEQALAAHLNKVVSGAPSAGKMPEFGAQLANIVLPDTIVTILDQFPREHVVVVHDAGASRIPWEAVYVNGRSLALSGGISHRYEADNLSVAKWLEERQQRPTLKVLLVINPTEDLAGAVHEGDRVEKLLREKGQAEVRRLEGAAARRAELLDCFQSGEFDVVHYAGHAFFDRAAPSRSGILCADREILSGADLAGLGSLPTLVFFNACEAGRIRRTGPDPAPAPDLLRRNVGFAEAFLRGGVANFIGTYWPVGDASAEAFAPAFYEGVMGGQSLAEALMASRKALEAAQYGDWADYILYGNPDFVLKRSGTT